MSELTPHRRGGERRSVERYLEAIICNAEQDADRVAAFLIAEGIEPTPESKRPAPPDQALLGPSAAMLLNLAAAMRLRSWERAGISDRIGRGVPTSTAALAAAGACGRGETVSLDIAREVFRTHLMEFAHTAQADLEADVLLDAKSGDDFLDQFAAFLLAVSQTVDQTRKERTEDDRKTEESR